MRPKKPLFSVIYVNFRSASLLADSLRSLPEPWEREVIVVNNDPSETDALRKIGLEHPIQLVIAPENRGFGAAANVGVTHASGKYLLFLNPDTVWQWGDFSEAARFFDSHPKLGVFGARLVNREGTPEPWSTGMPHSFLGILLNKLGFPSGRRIWESDRPVGAGWVSGAALFVEKDLFEDIGGFDERFFLYYEDADLCERIRRSGRNIASNPGIVIRHIRGGSQKESGHDMKWQFRRSQELYFRKHRPTRESVLISLFRSLLSRFA